MGDEGKVTLRGRLEDVRAEGSGDDMETGSHVVAVLAGNEDAGERWELLFPKEHVTDVLTQWRLARGELVVAVEGWVHGSQSAGASAGSTVVVVDRVIYLPARLRPRQAAGSGQVPAGRLAGHPIAARRTPGGMDEAGIPEPITVSALRANLPRVLKATYYFGRRYVILRNGDAVAVLLALDDFRALVGAPGARARISDGRWKIED